jgi:hypothetical protein
MLARALAGSVFALGLALAPAAAFDLRDWTRRQLPNSPTAFFECAQPRACGNGSAVSGRLQPLDAAPTGIEDERRRQQEIAQRLFEQMAGRITDIQTGDTREAPIEGLRALVTEKRASFTDGRRQFYIDALLFGPTRSYAIVSSGGDPEQVRRNFEGYARLMALVLDQLASADAAQTPQVPPPQAAPELPPTAPQPPQQTAPRPTGPPPSPPPQRSQAPPPQHRPPAIKPAPQHQPAPNYQEPPDYQPPPGNTSPPPAQGFPPSPPPANFPPPSPPPR